MLASNSKSKCEGPYIHTGHEQPQPRGQRHETLKAIYKAARTALGMQGFPAEPHMLPGNGNPRADAPLPFTGWELRLLLSLKGNDTPTLEKSRSSELQKESTAVS